MSVDAFALALMATEDADSRAAIAAGDRSRLEDTDLTDEEVELLTAAAKDDVEVEGYAFGDSPTFRAVDYARINQAEMSSVIRPKFAVFIQTNYGGIGGAANQADCHRS